MLSDNIVPSERVALVTRRKKPASKLRAGCRARILAKLPAQGTTQIDWRLIVEGAGLAAIVDGFKSVSIRAIKGPVPCRAETLKGKSPDACFGILLASLVKRIEFDDTTGQCLVRFDRMRKGVSGVRKARFGDDCRRYFD